MLSSRRTRTALLCASLPLTLAAPPARASGPASVTVRVEGLNETKLPPTLVTTTTTPLVKDGNSEHACAGTSALGALELATAGAWSGPWEASFKQYVVFSIEGESHLFEPGASANYFWSFWLNHSEASVGACEAEPESGQEVLFFPACFGEACPPAPQPLAIEAPGTAAAGDAVAVTVKRYTPTGVASAAPGASISYAGTGATTDASGRATLTFPAAGSVTLNVSAPQSVRTEATVCVHNGNDGTCGTPPTPAPGAASAPAGGSVAGALSRYRGLYALIANATSIIDGHVYPRARSPRVIAGSILAHSPVSSVGLELRRGYRGHCYAYDGVRERFRHSRCGKGSVFTVSRNRSFSYLLPAPLAPGRYVLDIEARDVAGNRTTLLRGTSRLVFYVR